MSSAPVSDYNASLVQNADDAVGKFRSEFDKLDMNDTTTRNAVTRALRFAYGAVTGTDGGYTASLGPDEHTDKFARQEADMVASSYLTEPFKHALNNVIDSTTALASALDDKGNEVLQATIESELDALLRSSKQKGQQRTPNRVPVPREDYMMSGGVGYGDSVLPASYPATTGASMFPPISTEFGHTRPTGSQWTLTRDQPGSFDAPQQATGMPELTEADVAGIIAGAQRRRAAAIGRNGPSAASFMRPFNASSLASSREDLISYWREQMARCKEDLDNAGAEIKGQQYEENGRTVTITEQKNGNCKYTSWSVVQSSSPLQETLDTGSYSPSRWPSKVPALMRTGPGAGLSSDFGTQTGRSLLPGRQHRALSSMAPSRMLTAA